MTRVNGRCRLRWANLAELRSLQLHDNDLTGSIPRELGGLGRLGWLWLNDNDLSGSLPEELAGLDSLRGLWVGNNRLEGSRARGAARRTGKCCGLCTKELGDLASLTRLNVSGNELRGPLPQSLTNLSLDEFAFYEATDGPNWYDSDNWLTDAPLGAATITWKGRFRRSCSICGIGCIRVNRLANLQLLGILIPGQCLAPTRIYRTRASK